MQETDRHLRETEIAEKVIARNRANNEKRKNALPPFLMVRSGLLNGWLVTLCTALLMAGSAAYTLKTHSNISWPDIGAAMVLILGIYYGAVTTAQKQDFLKTDIETIKNEFANYINSKDYTLDLTGQIYSHKLAKILMEHIVKYEPGIFDKLIDSPETVMDPETRSNIISGHLRKYPGAADRVIKIFQPNEISTRVYNTALKYATRLKNSEHER